LDIAQNKHKSSQKPTMQYGLEANENRAFPQYHYGPDKKGYKI